MPLILSTMGALSSLDGTICEVSFMIQEDLWRGQELNSEFYFLRKHSEPYYGSDIF